LVLQSTYLYFVSNEDHTFEKKNVSFLLVTSTLNSAFLLVACFEALSHAGATMRQLDTLRDDYSGHKSLKYLMEK